nr:nuclear transition protein 2 [Meriones unguiculatus]
MDTKMQSLSTTHSHPHSSSRPQGHTCNQCNCSHHCRSCSPAGHPSSSSSPSPSPPSRHPKPTTQSRHSPPRTGHHRGSSSKTRKTLEGKVSKRRAVRRRKRTNRAKRRSSGTCRVNEWETLLQWRVPARPLQRPLATG